MSDRFWPVGTTVKIKHDLYVEMEGWYDKDHIYTVEKDGYVWRVSRLGYLNATKENFDLAVVFEEEWI